MAAEPHQVPVEPTIRRVTIHGPDGSTEYQLRENSDDTIIIEVDGTPLVGFDHTGAGWWPDPDETWSRLYPSGTQIDRTVAITGITTETMWRDLEAHLGLPRYGLGRWKEWAADRQTILSHTYDLDAATAWATHNNLPYEDERNIRYDPATSPVPTSDHPEHQPRPTDTQAARSNGIRSGRAADRATAQYQADTWANAIGDDHIVVAGVAYDAHDWEHDGEGGVQPRRTPHAPL